MSTNLLIFTKIMLIRFTTPVMPPLLPYNMPNPLVRAAVEVQTSRIKEAIDEVMNHKMKDVVKELTKEIRKVRTASNPDDVDLIDDLQQQLSERNRELSTCDNRLEDAWSRLELCEDQEQLLQQQARQYSDHIVKMSSDIGRLQADVVALENNLGEEVKTTKVQRDALQVELAAKKSELQQKIQEQEGLVASKAQCEASLATLQKEQASLQELLSDLQEGISKFASMREALLEEHKVITEEMEQRHLSKEEILAQIQVVVSRLDQCGSATDSDSDVRANSDLDVEVEKLKSLDSENHLEGFLQTIDELWVRTCRNEEVVDLSAQIKSLKREAEDLKGEHAREAEDLRAQLSGQAETLARVVGEKDICRGVLRELQARVSQLEEDVESGSAEKNAELRAKISGMTETLESLEEELAACKAKTSGQSKTIGELESDVQACRRELEALQQRFNDLENMSAISDSSSDGGEDVVNVSNISSQSARAQDEVSDKDIDEYAAQLERTGEEKKFTVGPSQLSLQKHVGNYIVQNENYLYDQLLTPKLEKGFVQMSLFPDKERRNAKTNIGVSLGKFRPTYVFDKVITRLVEKENFEGIKRDKDAVVRLFFLIVKRLSDQLLDGVTYTVNKGKGVSEKYYFFRKRKSPRFVSGGSGFSLSNLFIWL